MTQTIQRVTLVLAMLLLVAGSASAITWQVRLHSGQVFETRYEPQDASFDATMITFLSDRGNRVALSKDLVFEVVTLTETLGFGTVLDNVTILIGQLLNDKPSAQEQAELDAEAALQQGFPNYTGGGIPLSFLSTTTPPMGTSQRPGGFADQRRGGVGGFANQRRSSGGDGVFAEPFSRDF